MTLAQLADEALQTLHVKMLPLKLCPNQGVSWNVGEYAVAYVRITNSTGLPLRDVEVDVELVGSAAVFQPVSSPNGWSHGSFKDELDPGEVWETYIALLKGVSAGSFQLVVTVGAEVMPFGRSPASAAQHSVLPPP